MDSKNPTNPETRFQRYRRRHPERVKAIQKASDEKRREKKAAWRAANETSIRAKIKAWREANAERIRQQIKDWAAANPGKRRAYRLAKYARDPQKSIDAHRVWAKENPEKIVAYSAKRRATQRNAPRNDLTTAEWQTIQDAFHHCCAYCGRKMARLTMDHITPLSKGGAHTMANIVPACRSCNAKKHTGAPLKPVQPLLL